MKVKDQPVTSADGGVRFEKKEKERESFRKTSVGNAGRLSTVEDAESEDAGAWMVDGYAWQEKGYPGACRSTALFSQAPIA